MAITDLTTLSIDDERLARRLAADFAILAGRNETVASGSDGVFAPSDRWTLTSASVDFAAQGVAAGNLCDLELNRAKVGLFAVESASGHSLTLRRPSLAAGVGQPPGPAAGGTGYTFKVPTLAPQIAAAASWVAGRYGFDATTDLTTVIKAPLLQEIAVLTACAFAYGMQSRQAGNLTVDDLAAQRKNYLTERDELVKLADEAYGLFPAAEDMVIGPLTATRFSVRRGRGCGPEFGTPRRCDW